jgi:hypothetical protein
MSLPLEWQAKVFRNKNYWSVELKIPLKTFYRIPRKGEYWSGNICRNITTSTDKRSTWAHLRKNFQVTHNFGRLLFKNDVSQPEASGTILAIKKKINKNLQIIAENEKRFADAAEKYPSLRKTLNSFLNDYRKTKEKIKAGNISSQEVFYLNKKSNILINKIDDLKMRILLNRLCHEN